MTKQIALVSGVTGQDGSYPAELLIKNGYEVPGIKCRSFSFNTTRIDHLYQGRYESSHSCTLHCGDLTDSSNLIRIILQARPDETYDLGAMSHVAASFESPDYSADTDGMGALCILGAIRILGLVKKARFYQATTSARYCLTQEIPQKETPPFYPRSPYAECKLCAVTIKVDRRYFRPTEVETLLGDPTKASDRLGCVPHIALQEMVTEKWLQNLPIASVRPC